MPDRGSLPDAGDLIGGKYSVTRVIGAGGMGVVYEAMHTRLRQRVALKMLLPELATRGDIVARFEREARAAAQLRSPHVARVLDVDSLSDGTPFMVMEFLEGRDLAAELVARGPLPIVEAVGYVLEACEAMAEAHRLGTVHRDLKPSNLFLADEGRKRTIKVLDFGISKVAGDGTSPSVTSTFSALGTALYMSPEQVRSAKHVDARCDVWALGVVLYELLAARPPFEGETATAVAAAVVADQPTPLRSLRPDVPIQLESAIMTALEKDRNNRFQDAAAFAGAIEPFALAHAAAPPPAAQTSSPQAAAHNLKDAIPFEEEETELLEQAPPAVRAYAQPASMPTPAAHSVPLPSAPVAQAPAATVASWSGAARTTLAGSRMYLVLAAAGGGLILLLGAVAAFSGGDEAPAAPSASAAIEAAPSSASTPVASASSAKPSEPEIPILDLSKGGGAGITPRDTAPTKPKTIIKPAPKPVAKPPVRKGALPDNPG